MGGSICCCRRSVPPPNSDLVGQWILNEKSQYFRIGCAKFRYKKGTNLLGAGLSKKQNQASVCRFIIHEDGMIEFYQYTPDHWTVIDGPAYSWKNGKIKAYAHSILDYDLSLFDQKDTIIVNKMVLRRKKVPEIQLRVS